MTNVQVALTVVGVCGAVAFLSLFLAAAVLVEFNWPHDHWLLVLGVLFAGTAGYTGTLAALIVREGL